MSEHHAEHHVVPLKIYFLIFFALMIGTVITVAAAFVDMGFLNTPVALIIALVKASLVILFFMHVKYSPKLVGLFRGCWLLLAVHPAGLDHAGLLHA